MSGVGYVGTQAAIMKRRIVSGLLAAALSVAGLGAAWAQVDVNLATEAQLDGILGLGPATTRRILAEREKAPFKNWADLLARVKGIGTQSAVKLCANGLNVNGQAFEPCQRK